MKISAVKKLFVGSPLATAQARHERLGKASGLAIFASDPLSSNAYATEEILHVLILAGAVALSYSLPIAVGIAALILIVISSYRQTIRAYPQGGGAYIVAKDNLGVFPSLIAGAALLTDYVLTVAVSVAAGIAALTSAMPELLPYRIALCVLVVIGITVANLRGVRESSRLFALPTYFFVISILVMVAYGVVGIAFGWLRETPYEPHPPGLEGVGVFLFLRAFAAGCTALTGIEAVSDGVPAFRPPEAHNARIVMAWLGAMTVLMFLGITYLANHFGIVPGGDETVVSKIARHVFGSGLFYFEIQAVTMLILLLAANTSYADFPRLSFFMARDGFMPRQFSSQGDRLVFSNGILILAGLAILLLIGFQGDTHSLLPLYAIGVFISFTVSQSGMVRRWLRLREEGWWWRIWFNAVGATVTGLVMLTLAVTKFTEGAWIVVALVPMLVGGLLMVRRHYQQVAAQLSLEHFESSSIRNTTLVLVGDLHRGVVQALQYAKAISADARAVYVEVDPEKTRKLEEKWVKWGMGVPLVVLNSPYRSLLPPFLEYLDSLLALGEDQMVTIVIPEFIPAKWWQQLLHNQTALLIKGALLFRRNVVVTDVPYHLRR